IFSFLFIHIIRHIAKVTDKTYISNVVLYSKKYSGKNDDNILYKETISSEIGSILVGKQYLVLNVKTYKNKISVKKEYPPKLHQKLPSNLNPIHGIITDKKLTAIKK
ncbi:MAG TPA: hypothetical protein VFQ56_08795, partial [Flavobacterium sp.]|nr:hypothetical protein [Flavobacterium sp.]